MLEWKQQVIMIVDETNFCPHFKLSLIPKIINEIKGWLSSSAENKHGFAMTRTNEGKTE